MILSDGSHEMTRRVVESISKVKNDSNVNMYVVLNGNLTSTEQKYWFFLFKNIFNLFKLPVS